MSSPYGSPRPPGTGATPPFAAPGASPPGARPAAPRPEQPAALRVEEIDDADAPWPGPDQHLRLPGEAGWAPPAPWAAGDPWGAPRPAAPMAPVADAWARGAAPWALGGDVVTAPLPPERGAQASPAPRGTLPAGAPPLVYPSEPPTAGYAPPVPPGRTPAPVAPAPPEPVRRSPWVVATAVLSVLVLLLGVGLAITVGDDGDGAAEAADREPRELPPTGGAPDATLPPAEEPPATEPEPAPDVPTDDITAVIDDIEAFVAAERGLPFLRDVVVELEDDAAFEARLLADFEEGAEDLRIIGDAFAALGLVEPGVELADAYRELLGIGVVGFYDPSTEELVVRGTEASPYVRTVIAHELVHALDDQHFDIDRDFADTPDESGFGFTAVLEGNAVRIEEAYRATFTPDEEDAATTEELSIGLGVDPFAIPFVLLESLAAPYELGPVLVEAILAAGGDEALAGAIAVPPTTSEQVLEPDVFVAGEAAVPVPVPVADGPVVDEGAFGAFTLGQLLAEIGVDPSTAAAAVDGWGGDAYVQWDDAGGATCVRVAVVGDTAADTAELAEALTEAADGSPATASVAVAEAGGPVTYTSCG
ncbi:MAG: hypothetical protein WKF93_02895 [Acidimicrobiales bacterium]